MLKQKQMPHYLWGEAAATAAYLINRSPTKKLQDKTPEVGMAMGTQWAGYYSTHPHTRVCKKYLYPAPYPRGQKLKCPSPYPMGT